MKDWKPVGFQSFLCMRPKTDAFCEKDGKKKPEFVKVYFYKLRFAICLCKHYTPYFGICQEWFLHFAELFVSGCGFVKVHFFEQK